MNLLHFHARKIAVCILIVEFSPDVFEFLIVVVAVVVLAATASCVRTISLIFLWLLKRSIRLEYTYRNCELNIIYKHTTGEKSE